MNDLPFIINELQKYSLNDIWNAEEFGQMYKIHPNSTVGTGRLPENKKNKYRLSYLACAHADGSEKFPMLVIGRSKKPKCFGNHSAAALGFN